MKNKKDIKEYKLVKELKDQGENKFPSIGIYKNGSGKYIIKTLNNFKKNNFYSQLMQEAYIFKTLSGIKNNRIKFPKLIEVINGDRTVSMVTEFIDGKKLSQFPNEFKLSALSEILKSLSSLPNMQKLNTKRHIEVLVTFPVYLLILILRDFKNLSRYMNLALLFFKNYTFSYNNSKYIFAHRDLHADNIIVSDSKLSIIDPEVAMNAESETDLAISVRPFSRTLGFDLDNFLEKQLTTTESRKRFIGLAIYYAIQIMAIRPKDWDDYSEAQDYLEKYFSKTYKNLLTGNKLSIAEVTYFSTLKLISFLNQKLNLPTKALPIILCYHSISNDNWRFSLDTNSFYAQIDYLIKNRKIVSLRNLLNTNSKDSSEISLTFDDGYKDIIDLLPYFKKNKITGTLFVIGNSKNANRSELDNNKSLLSLEEIKKVKRAGWEIGFHTKTHADLSRLSSSQLRSEIIDGKIKLERELGFKIEYFAYPRGIYSKKIVETVREAGFKAAFTVDGGNYQTTDNAYLINRIGIEGNIRLNEFQSLITPLGTFFSKYFMLILKTKNSLGI